MPYKITRLESYKADQTKSGDSLKHYGRKGMKWDKNIFGKEDVPGQSRSSSSGPPPSKALSSVLNTRVAGPRLLNNTYFNPVTRKDAQKTNMALRSNPGLPLAGTPSPNKVRIAGGSSELVKKQTEEPKKDTRNGLQKWFDQAGKDIGKAAGDVKNWGEGAVNDTKKWVEGAANDTKKWADQAGKDIGRAVKTTKNSVEKTVTDAIRGTGQWVERTANDAKEWTDNAIKDVSKAAVKVGDDAKKVAEKAKTTIDFAVNDTKKWTDNAIKDIGKTAVKIGDDAKKAYGDAEKWVNGAIKDVGKAAVKVGDDAKKAYGDAKKWVDTAIGDTKKWGEGAVNDTKKWTDQAGKDVSTFVDNLINGSNSKQARKEAAAKEIKDKAHQKRVDYRNELDYRKGPRRPEKEINSDLYTRGVPNEHASKVYKDQKLLPDLKSTAKLLEWNAKTQRRELVKKFSPKQAAERFRDAKQPHTDPKGVYRNASGAPVTKEYIRELVGNSGGRVGPEGYVSPVDARLVYKESLKDKGGRVRPPDTYESVVKSNSQKNVYFGKPAEQTSSPTRTTPNREAPKSDYETEREYNARKNKR